MQPQARWEPFLHWSRGVGGAWPGACVCSLGSLGLLRPSFTWGFWGFASNLGYFSKRVPGSTGPRRCSRRRILEVELA